MNATWRRVTGTLHAGGVTEADGRRRCLGLSEGSSRASASQVREHTFTMVEVGLALLVARAPCRRLRRPDRRRRRGRHENDNYVEPARLAEAVGELQKRRLRSPPCGWTRLWRLHDGQPAARAPDLCGVARNGAFNRSLTPFVSGGGAELGAQTPEMGPSSSRTDQEPLLLITAPRPTRHLSDAVRRLSRRSSWRDSNALVPSPRRSLVARARM